MEIGLIYSAKDPRQTAAREFVRDWCAKRGILVSIVESEQPVASPTLVINGHRLTEQRQNPRGKSAGMFPNLQMIEEALERHLWAV